MNEKSSNNEIIFNDIEEFQTQLLKLNINKIVIATVNEKRAIQVNPETLQVQHIKTCDILAYQEGILYKCQIDDIDATEIYKNFSEEGFSITLSNRNVT